MHNEDLIEKRLKDIPESHRANYLRAMRGGSRTAAVKGFCLECMMWQKEEIRKCTSKVCPLYPYRPYQ